MASVSVEAFSPRLVKQPSPPVNEWFSTVRTLHPVTQFGVWDVHSQKRLCEASCEAGGAVASGGFVATSSLPASGASTSKTPGPTTIEVHRLEGMHRST